MKSSANLLNKYVKFKPEFSDPGDDTINKKVIEDNGNRVLIRFEVPGLNFQPTQTVLKSMIEKVIPKKKTFIKNPARKKTAAKKQRSPEKQYKDFHHKTGHKSITDTIDIPDKFIHIGKAVSLIYESDKFDGKPRLYKHDFKKHGNILAKPEGKSGFSDLILMNNLKFKIKKEGITG